MKIKKQFQRKREIYLLNVTVEGTFYDFISSFINLLNCQKFSKVNIASKIYLPKENNCNVSLE